MSVNFICRPSSVEYKKERGHDFDISQFKTSLEIKNNEEICFYFLSIRPGHQL
jgi:hypothetical protein